MGELLSVIAYTLQDETERGIEFSNLAKIDKMFANFEFEIQFIQAIIEKFPKIK